VDRSESAASSLPPALPLALTAESPAQLFRRANEARQAARWRDATSAYETLIQRFPNSAEAGLALLTLGKLRLASGDAAGAEVALRQHLMRTPGSTRAEALWNLAAVLEQRGRRQEARATLRQLLAEYPNSPYDSAVQARLESD
jgi:TolA-binding protein